MERTITIFGSSIPKPGEEQYEFAYQLGARLAEEGFNICTGGYAGIMEAASKGAYDKGGLVYAVTVDHWNSKPNPYITIEVRGKTLFERIEKLIEMGDGYVVLQGGTGTFLELAAIWEYANKKLQPPKPILCHSEMWKSIVAVMDKQMQLEGRETGIVKSCESVDEIVSDLKNKLK
jgi:uncharacterized protein (TIGR00725 family)